ncbi:MAG: peptide deformylase [Pseudomonadota bacterium]
MTIRPIVHVPDPILRTASKPLETVDDTLRAFLDDMADTMYDAPGIGLAAIQVGEPVRAVTIDVSKKENEEDKEPPRDPIFLVNPEIIWQSDELSSYEEGCLSIPDYYAEVQRPARCRVSYLDRNGKACELGADGLLATCVQHEIDHLNGILFIDYLSKLKRDMVIRKFTKIARQNGK